jgi:CheY-like chemotaxis protein
MVEAVLPRAPRRVLVVEDDADTLAVLTELVAALGHTPAPVTRGREALRAAERVRPDVVLLDVGLPDVDRYEVARRLRASSSACDALLVAVTGFGGPRDLERSRAVGFDQHVVKPAGLTELSWILDQVPVARRSPRCR